METKKWTRETRLSECGLPDEIYNFCLTKGVSTIGGLSDTPTSEIIYEWKPRDFLTESLLRSLLDFKIFIDGMNDDGRGTCNPLSFEFSMFGNKTFVKVAGHIDTREGEITMYNRPVYMNGDNVDIITEYEFNGKTYPIFTYKGGWDYSRIKYIPVIKDDICNH